MYPSSMKKMMLAMEESLVQCGTELIDCDIVQPAEPFLNMAGEDLRRRIFLTQSTNGQNHCLRPEFTIPVCSDHIQNNGSAPQRYGYLGPVFRQRQVGKTEFHQAGIEDLGDPDIAKADALAISDAMRLTNQYCNNISTLTTLGDQNIFATVLQALGLPLGWQQRLLHAFGNPDALELMLTTLRNPSDTSNLDAKLSTIIENEDHKALASYLANIMQETGYSTHASRSPDEIAARLIEQQQLAKVHLSDEQFSILSKFLSMELPLSEALSSLTSFASEANLDIQKAFELFSARISQLENLDIDSSKIQYVAAFGRPLDYYTGLVFEVSNKANDEVLAAGGRYDRLMSLLGANSVTPAVGFSLWLDRFEVA
ncbi:ATP phosphoribosyltransferase regulatory subunit [Lentilitoribacter sp. Alg239-R112]|jgi:ATP phosphoribosyltransferase regulatory subunit|uniref:ATP phosphoribosyltransferase regulatory subunit n=1 Tax=Lentilitoribacter sp. Alg239-R112 TaxID=2305987 RepID=UPI0013A70240|nr:ATP phosphoribosyltransferase regulatory subunit [Lentilitoribacter sp. Alg239-R112]